MKEVHVRPLYHANSTYKGGVYRVSFLIGGCLAKNALIYKTFPTSPNLAVGSDGVCRVFHSSAEVAGKITAKWLRKNKEVA